MVRAPLRPLFLALGWLSLGLGAIGVFLPLLPTTPFVLLAAFFFSRSSARLHRWLQENRIFGPSLRDWEDHGVIRLKAKILASVMMALLFGSTLVFVPVGPAVKVSVAAIGVCVAAFIWSRPSRPGAGSTPL